MKKSKSAMKKRHNNRMSRTWFVIETVMVFTVGWLLADEEIMKQLRKTLIPMGWEPEKVLMVPVRVLPDYDPMYDAAAADPGRILSNFNQMGELLASVEGVETVTPCGALSPGVNNQHYVGAFRDSSHFISCAVMHRVTGSDFIGALGYRWVLPEGGLPPEQDVSGKVIVSEDLAEFLFPGENPVGRSFQTNENGSNTIVGVVSRQKVWEITGVPVPVMIVNVPASGICSDISNGYAGWMVRAEPDADIEELTAAVNLRLSSSQAAFGNIRARSAWPMHNQVRNNEDVTFYRVGIVFLLLNMVLGVLSFWLLYSRKNKDEYGVRTAMGATPSRLRLNAMLQSVGITAVAVGIGLLIVFNLSLATGRDPAVLGAVRYGAYPSAESMAPWPLITSGFLSGIVVTVIVAGVIFLINALAALFSVWKVTGMRPSEALQEE